MPCASSGTPALAFKETLNPGTCGKVCWDYRVYRGSDWDKGKKNGNY